MQELIQLIKNTKIPIICICNDRQSQKIRSLANHCFDLRFYKPRTEQLRVSVQSFCKKSFYQINWNGLAICFVLISKGKHLAEVSRGSRKDKTNLRCRSSYRMRLMKKKHKHKTLQSKSMPFFNLYCKMCLI